jgi:hypothetical protein
MQYIDPVEKALLASKLKTGNKRVSIRVEVDKLVFNPTGTTEIDTVKFLTSSADPAIVKGAENETSASYMICPLRKDFKEVVITSKWGMRPNPFDHSKTEMHHGLDMDGGEGDDILCVADGVVTFAGWSDTGGNMIQILHANGIMTRYLHMIKLLVKTGDTVIQGQHIGEMGSTGRSTGAHLHFDVRVNATKADIGESVDPTPYLTGSSHISEVATIQAGEGQTGTVNASVLNLLQYPKITTKVIKTLAKGSSLEIISKTGEWYKVKAGADTGYVYGKYVTLDGGTGGSSTLTRRQQIILSAKTQAAKYPGVDYRFLLAIAQHETEMGTTGAGQEPLNAILGYDVTGAEGHPRPEYQGFDNQMYYGAKRVYDSMKSKNFKTTTKDDVEYFHNGGDMGTAYTWSGSGQSWIDETWTCLQTIMTNSTAWDVPDDVGGESISSTFGSIKGSAVNVRKQPTVSAATLGAFNTGHVFEYYQTVTNDEGAWYEVKYSNTQVGYVLAKYFTPNSKPITSDYALDKLFYDNFSQYGYLSSVENTYQQTTYQGKPVWLVSTDWINRTNYLYCTPLTNTYGKYYVQIAKTVFNAGRLDVKYKLDCAQGNKLNIYVDGKVVLSRSGKFDTWQTFSTPVSGGTHTIKIERERNIEGNDDVRIGEIALYQFLYKNNKDDSSTAEVVSTNTVDSKWITITADEAEIQDGKSTFANVVGRLKRGDTIELRETIANGGKAQDGYYEVDYNDNISYIREDLGQLMTKESSSMIVNTGNFIFDRTYTLPNVISVEIDNKYEMRSAEAIITISNEDGFYSPDYKPNSYSGKATQVSPYVEYEGDDIIGVLDENTPIRIYIGYGDKPARKFTGLIDSVDMDSESRTLTIRCTDMMKKLNNYYIYSELKYPPEDENTAWLVSSVICDMASKAGMSSWRVKSDDLAYPDIVVEESYYTDLSPTNGTYVAIQDNIPVVKSIDSLPVDGGYRNPCVWINTPFKVGTNLGDAADELCQNVGYWQRCDYYGTYWATPVMYSSIPVYTFRDTENIVSVSKTIDNSRTINHLIISGGDKEEHFFDMDLWKAAKGERKTGGQVVDWANSYGLKQLVATKMFQDMKMRSRTLQVCVEGNPFVELLDTVAIEDMQTATKDNYVIKGIRDTYNVDQGYLTFLDLFWYRE